MLINSTFSRLVTQERLKPFVWGENDCALFVANIYKAYMGTDFAEAVRGTYDNEYHGMRKIVELGGWEKILTDRGFVKINKNFTKRGDVVVSQGALGIWIGNNNCAFAGGALRSLDEVEEAYTLK